jgi:FtsP/CotA-like multicopper oxidase with cupredoxin domain
MTIPAPSPSRRAILAGLGGAALAGLTPAAGQNRPALELRLRPATAPLRPGAPESPVGRLAGGAAEVLRFAQGGEVQVTVSNELSVPTLLNCLGIDGATDMAALAGATPLAPGGRATFALPLRRGGTFLVAADPLGDAALPCAARALVVTEPAGITADRDEALLIEDWRLAPDGRAVAAGRDAAGTTAVYTINGRPSLDIAARPNERLRLRVLNASPRTPVGLAVENHDIRVIAIDGQPAEPFLARDSRIVLAPGARIDVLIDATRAPGTISPIVLHDGGPPRPIARIVMSDAAPARPAPLPPSGPLPATDLPARLDLQGALRASLTLGAGAPWLPPMEAAAAAPAFRAPRGRTVVLALSNPAAAPVVARLNGHHMRLLDKLDDGWKPFWLDTLLVGARQTERVAFAAEHAGRWLLETTGLGWAAPRLAQSYAVD